MTKIDAPTSNLGNVYIADIENNRIRKVTVSTGIITTIAGTGSASYSGDGEAATSAALYRPFGVAVDTSGTIAITITFSRTVTQYVADLVIILECRKLMLPFPSRQRVHR